MNWVISKSEKIKFHTYLNEILAPIREEVENFNWIIADIEFGSWNEGLPVNMDEDYFILSSSEFNELVDADVQIWWGVILGVPKKFNIAFEDTNLPFVEGCDLIWENDFFQYPSAEIEIDCFDSSFTIVKFKNQELSAKFRAYFPEAVELENFK